MCPPLLHPVHVPAKIKIRDASSTSNTGGDHLGKDYQLGKLFLRYIPYSDNSTLSASVIALIVLVGVYCSDFDT